MPQTEVDATSGSSSAKRVDAELRRQASRTGQAPTASNVELRALIQSRHQAFDLGESRPDSDENEVPGPISRERCPSPCRTQIPFPRLEPTKLIDYYRGSRPNTIRWRDFVL